MQSGCHSRLADLRRFRSVLGVEWRGIEQCLAHEVENNFHFLRRAPNRPKILAS
jgi:hypothetical protein